MSLKIDCRLCANTCNDYKRLYDERLQCITDLYEIAVKYFDPLFLTSSNVNEITALCPECWHLIEDFDEFQQKICKIQAKLLQVSTGELEKSAASETAMTKTSYDEHFIKSEYEFSNPVEISNLASENLVKTIANNPAMATTSSNSTDAIANNITSSASGNFSTVQFVIFKNEQQTVSLDTQIDDLMQQSFLGNITNIEITKEASAEPDEEFETETCNKSEISGNEDAANINESDNEENDLEYQNEGFDEQIDGVERTIRELTEGQTNDQIIAAWRPMLDCPICQMEFQNFNSLGVHFEQSHTAQKFYFKCCNFRFRTYPSLVEHALFHLHPKILECEFCKKSYKHKYSLKRHLAQCRPKYKCTKLSKCQISLACGICHSAQATFSALQQHFEQQHSNATLSILCCGQQLDNGKHILDHFVEHNYNDGDGRSCVICGKVFQKVLSLKDHLSNHLNLRLYKCLHCPEIFGYSSQFYGHVKRHHSSKSQKKIQKWIEAMKNKQNNEFTNFDINAIVTKCQIALKCGICHSVHATFEALQQHFQQQHSNATLFLVCCGQQLDDVESLLDHVVEHNYVEGEGRSCVICSRVFPKMLSLKEHLINHLNLHLYKCLHCPKTFGYNTHFYAHVKRYHPLEWQQNPSINKQLTQVIIN